MTMKEQLSKLKENWLLIALIVLILGALQFSNTASFASNTFAPSYAQEAYYDGDSEALKSRGITDYSIMPVPPQGGFAPGVEDRQITKTASLTTEVKRGTFFSNQEQVLAIVDQNKGYILNQNVNKYDVESRSYNQGSYQIKVEVQNYNAVLSALQDLGEVTYFNENGEDVTGQVIDLNVELTAEKERLARYKQMLAEATTTADKIELNDRIFNQERTIKYLEEALRNVGQRIEYGTIYFQLNEKQSEYVDIALVKFSELVRSLVNSINSLLRLIVVVLPYALVGLLIWAGVRYARKRK